MCFKALYSASSDENHQQDTKCDFKVNLVRRKEMTDSLELFWCNFQARKWGVIPACSHLVLKSKQLGKNTKNQMKRWEKRWLKWGEAMVIWECSIFRFTMVNLEVITSKRIKKDDQNSIDPIACFTNLSLFTPSFQWSESQRSSKLLLFEFLLFVVVWVWYFGALFTHFMHWDALSENLGEK